jgi:predicted Zn-dependent protease
MAKSDTQLMSELTIRNENELLNNHALINAPWFEKTCLNISEKMQFQKINQCKVFKSKDINAYVLANGHVYFSSAIMLQLKNRHQWAAIIAHENAHLELDHYLKLLHKLQKPGFFFPKSKIKNMQKQHELEADAFSEKTLQNFGFDPSQISYFFKRIISINGNNKSDAHLLLSTRLKKTIKEEIIDREFLEKAKTFQQL